MNPSPRKIKSHGSASSPEEHTFVALAFSGFQVIKGLHTLAQLRQFPMKFKKIW
jgi:hypothetical protein